MLQTLLSSFDTQKYKNQALIPFFDNLLTELENYCLGLKENKYAGAQSSKASNLLTINKHAFKLLKADLSQCTELSLSSISIERAKALRESILTKLLYEEVEKALDEDKSKVNLSKNTDTNDIISTAVKKVFESITTQNEKFFFDLGPLNMAFTEMPTIAFSESVISVTPRNKLRKNAQSEGDAIAKSLQQSREEKFIADFFEGLFSLFRTLSQLEMHSQHNDVIVAEESSLELDCDEISPEWSPKKCTQQRQDEQSEEWPSDSEDEKLLRKHGSVTLGMLDKFGNYLTSDGGKSEKDVIFGDEQLLTPQFHASANTDLIVSQAKLGDTKQEKSKLSLLQTM